MDILSFFLICIIFLFIYFFFNQFNILRENISYSEHKSFGAEKKKPIILGGIFILVVFLIFDLYSSIYFKISAALIMLLGIMSDRNILPNPKLRLFIQIFILYVLVHFEGLQINDLRHDMFNSLLSNDHFNKIFTVFCLAILINGSNFIDGLNGLLSGYFLIVIISLFLLSNYNLDLIEIDKNFLKIVFISLSIFIIFNLLGFVYLGDSGSYLISFLLGVFLIKFYTSNSYVSPYYIACLLWYPAFENFFSLIRRILKKKNVSDADNLHFHQLIFLALKSKKIIQSKTINSLTGLLIVFINIPSMIIGSYFASKSNILLLLITINIILYLFFYYFLFQQFIRNK
tara:strand:- start:1127 stop:2158 length:1032 start_codon:yes stop_codon:yes gene_type:complete